MIVGLIEMSYLGLSAKQINLSIWLVILLIIIIIIIIVVLVWFFEAGFLCVALDSVLELTL